MTSHERLLGQIVLVLTLLSFGVEIEAIPTLPSGLTSIFDCKNCKNCTNCVNTEKQLQMKILLYKIKQVLGYGKTTPSAPDKENAKTNDRPPGGIINMTSLESGIFADSEPADSCDSGILRFAFNRSISDIRGAELFVHILKGKRRRQRTVRLTVFSVNAKGKNRRKVASLKTKITKTEWKKLTLPQTKIRKLLKTGKGALRLMIKCKRCNKNVKLVLPFKTRERRKKKRRNCRRNAKKMRKLEKHRPILIIHPSSEESDRKKRSHRAGVQCSYDTRRGQGCCRYSQFVHFSEIGWDSFIISPAGFTLTECRGHCNHKTSNPSHFPDFSPRGQHRKTSVASHCTPSSRSAFEFFYFNDNHDLTRMRIDEAIIDRCNCL